MACLAPKLSAALRQAQGERLDGGVLEISEVILSKMREEAASAHPSECCGILLGAGDHITQAMAAANIHPTPETHFEIDPQALIDAHRAARSGGPQVLGYYHSHPNGRAEPSATDAKQAAEDGSVWAIITLNEITLWRAGKQGFTRVHYREVDG